MKNIINKQLIIILIIFLGLSFGLIFGIAKPRFSTFKQRYKELSETQTKLASLTAKKENLIKLKKDETRIENALKIAENILPDQKQTAQFLVQLEAASSETGNTLKSINISEGSKKKETSKEEEGLEEKKTKEEVKPSTPAPYQTINFSINLNGNFKQLLDFLTISESLARFVSFPSLTITSGPDNLIETKLEGEIYYK
jgi:Tfp pilus assembly protein PilO